jgi:hypothetical protein
MPARTFYVQGAPRDDINATVNIIVDTAPGQTPHAVAKEIAGPEYAFFSSINIDAAVDAAAKNRLLTQAELSPQRLNSIRKRAARRDDDPATYPNFDPE